MWMRGGEVESRGFFTVQRRLRLTLIDAINTDAASSVRVNPSLSSVIYMPDSLAFLFHLLEGAYARRGCTLGGGAKGFADYGRRREQGSYS